MGGQEHRHFFLPAMLMRMRVGVLSLVWKSSADGMRPHRQRFHGQRDSTVISLTARHAPRCAARIVCPSVNVRCEVLAAPRWRDGVLGAWSQEGGAEDQPKGGGADVPDDSAHCAAYTNGKARAHRRHRRVPETPARQYRARWTRCVTQVGTDGLRGLAAPRRGFAGICIGRVRVPPVVAPG